MCSSIVLWITSNVRKYCQRENIFLTSSYLNPTFYYSIRMLHCINLKMHFIYGSDVFFGMSTFTNLLAHLMMVT